MTPSPKQKLKQLNDIDTTPVDQDQLAALIPGHVATLGQLNQVEAANIALAQLWLMRRRLTPNNVLTERFVRQVHQRMFSDVWKWAGSYRRRQIDWPAEIGSAPWDIAPDVVNLCADAQLWAGTLPITDLDAARFHHRLVVIHPFPNGNGRHARLLTDTVLRATRAQPFTWARSNLSAQNTIRSEYINALRTADKSLDFSELIAFARS